MPMSEIKGLETLRQEIDLIDREIHALLNRRARCAEQVAHSKLADYRSQHG